MEIVWEANTSAYATRKRAVKACRPCQKNKKRCPHTFAISSTIQPTPRTSDNDLTDLTQRQPSQEQPDRHGPIQFAQPYSCETTAVEVAIFYRAERAKQPLTEPQKNYLESVGAFRALPKATQDMLVTSYITCIDGFLPIVDGGKLLRDYSSGQASPFLIQAVCMVACKTPQAAPYLRLQESSQLLDPVTFARSLHVGLDAAMKANLEVNRVTRIQILTLMHLHNDGPHGIEDASSHLAQAVHDAWTASIHFEHSGRLVTDEPSLLWWSIWVLDRFNACICGRPILTANHDIHLPRPPVGAGSRLQIMAAWLRLGDLLDEVLDLYRPTAERDLRTWGDTFPCFADLMQGIDFSAIQESHRSKRRALRDRHSSNKTSRFRHMFPSNSYPILPLQQPRNGVLRAENEGLRPNTSYHV